MIIVVGCFLLSFILAAFGTARAVHRRREEARRIAALEAEKRQKAEAAREKARRAAEHKAAAQAVRVQQQAARAVEAERKRAEKAAAQAARYEEQQRKRAEKIEAARILAEYNERALKAARELKALEAGQRPETISEAKPAPAPAPVQEAPAAPEAAPAPAKRPETISAPEAFSGEAVAFTGRIPTMTRAEAIKEVQKRGGSGFQRICSRCTVLVIGQEARETTIEKARGWNIPTITWEEWFARAEISWRRRQHAQAMGWL